MKNYIPIAFIIGVLCLPLRSTTANAANDTSNDGLYSFQLEADGISLPTWHWNGYTYVAGRQGQRYNIRVFNHSAQRVEAVVTVDGRDAISGQPGDYRQNRGYVIDAYSSVLIKGFRTSWRDVAGFYFTDIEDSYSARMGSAQHVGVIGVAVFEEKTQRHRKYPVYVAPAPRKRGLGTGYGHSRSTAPQESEAAKSARMDAAESMDGDGAPASRRGTTRKPAPSQHIGTGFGSNEYSPASSTEFNRKSRRPNARLSIYYDDRENLIARGVIPQPRRRPSPQPNPFPRNTDSGFAPPPPTYYWE